MPRYPKYATTVIGAYSVPDWFEPLDRLLAVGQLSMASMADAQFRASQAAMHDQEIAGIDVVTGANASQIGPVEAEAGIAASCPPAQGLRRECLD
jgi:hypothetical protein